MLIMEFYNLIGFEGYYTINKDGVIKSVERYINRGPNRNPQLAKERIIKNQLNWQGYLTVDLIKDGVKKKHAVHRLVGLMFVPNPENLPILNHKDGIKLNISIENLEWCTFSHNNQHAFDIGLKRGKATQKSGADNHNSKTVYQYDREKIFIKTFVNATEAASALGVSRGAVKSCARRERNTCAGFILSYEKLTA
jgi:hypothetical protein